ncbi:hypothetical protein C8J57DRAFT_1503457 [Mycena rebaudengoi]|nr:hypothetical protein C8J57DRAFT_1503457 [Mycena rebaudengoi]
MRMVAIRVAPDLRRSGAEITQGGGATAADAIRAVAVMLEHRRVDRMLDDIREEIVAMGDLAAVAAGRDVARAEEEAAAAHTLLEAASVMTRTVEEQVDVLRSTTVFLEKAAGQAEEAAEAYKASYLRDGGGSGGPDDHAADAGGYGGAGQGGAA